MSLSVTAALPVWARNAREADLLLSSLQSLPRHGLPIVLADGGSEEAFLEQVAALPGVVLIRREEISGGLPGQVKAALARAGARDAAYLLYTEPDKCWFFEHRLRDFLAPAVAAPEPALRIAARDAPSFATFPSGQRLTETLTNRLCAEVLGEPGDYLYGPLLLPSALLPYLAMIPEDIGWGWRIFLMAVARRLGLPLRHWVAHLPCPVEQQSEDDEQSRIYRMEQMAQNVRGLALGRKCPLDRVSR